MAERKKYLHPVRKGMCNARVLVVDDIVTCLDIARVLMRPFGLQVDCLDSGKEAICAIREEKNRYDAVFMDYMMPEMDGIETVRIIREDIGTEYAKNIPIIALTASSVNGSAEMFLSKGFQAFISKPIDIKRLDRVLKTWIEDRQNRAASPDSALLNRLLEASSHFKTADMEKIINELESHKYKSGGDLVFWLRDQMDHLKYDAIHERLVFETIFTSAR